MKAPALMNAARAAVTAVAVAVAGTMLCTPALAQATAPSAGAGLAAQEAPTRRMATRDIEPVYRGGTVDTLATIRKRGVLRVGVALSVPTVMHAADGKLVGFSIDAARRLADDMGVGVEFVETSWSGIIPDLLDREFDLIMSGLWVTVPRALVINFTTPVAGGPRPTGHEDRRLCRYAAGAAGCASIPEGDARQGQRRRRPPVAGARRRRRRGTGADLRAAGHRASRARPARRTLCSAAELGIGRDRRAQG